MRKFFLLAVLLTSIASCDNKKQVIPLLYGDEQEELASDRSDGYNVYICTGGSSRKYHRTKNCKGLSNCGGTIEAVSLDYAEDMGRTPCRICY